MRFALAPEQRDFAGSLRKICETAGTPNIVRAWSGGDHRGGRGLLRQLAGAGALGLVTEERFGGFGATPVDLVVAFVEFGRAAAPGPLVETGAVIPALLQALPDIGPAQRWLPALAEGRVLGTIAPAADLPALDADTAEVVLAVDGDRLTAAHRAGPIRSVDSSRRLFSLVADETVAAGDAVRTAASAAFDAGVLACAAQTLGAGRALLDTSVSYVKQRRQFGKPIGQYQAVKHHLANVLIALEMAEPLLYRAALSVASGDAGIRARDVSAAKVACTDAAHGAARTALQVHGAIGYTAEFDLSLWLTKVMALRTAWGTVDFHRERVASALRTDRTENS
ncbi:acyl-CoA dehydrogenase family protein [Nocardia aurantia]|uniref:Crotonobetainyl-CoA dehydrogenase n=1 Tax=Nocardia aurantia TaxID=2585199 RepID=A0A7K0DFT4_9NOCA|nr:acyl-CoA dehydrogenase family protein [Nocardia aurantia]MQY24567.1 Crotonobetainyl-CoA dehydrogenase [Nocardia aurantia]